MYNWLRANFLNLVCWNFLHCFFNKFKKTTNFRLKPTVFFKSGMWVRKVSKKFCIVLIQKKSVNHVDGLWHFIVFTPTSHFFAKNFFCFLYRQWFFRRISFGKTLVFLFQTFRLCQNEEIFSQKSSCISFAQIGAINMSWKLCMQKLRSVERKVFFG